MLTRPHPLPQPVDMVADMVHTGVSPEYLKDDHLWVPQTQAVSMKPLLLHASQGYYVNLLRVRPGYLRCHRHSGPVHAFVIRGTWRYLEHDWVAHEGSYVFEPPGETHTLHVADDVPEMITLFHVTGGYTYLDEGGQSVGYEDVFTKIDLCRRHYQSLGLGEDYLQSLIR